MLKNNAYICIKKNNKMKGLLIEDDPNGLDRAINAARSQNLKNELAWYTNRSVEWTWVKSYKEFCEYINDCGLPDLFAFDHDLNDGDYLIYHKNGGYLHKDIDYDEYKEKTGYHCAKWLVDFCLDNKLTLTSTILAHSMNVKGRENILALLNNFKKFQEKNG